MPRGEHHFKQNSISKMTINEPNDPKGPGIYYDDLRVNVLRPPHGTTRAAVSE